VDTIVSFDISFQPLQKCIYFP